MTKSNAVAVVPQARTVKVPFHGAELYVVSHNDEPYVPVKSVSDAIGLAWQPQHRKMAANSSRWGMVEITIPSIMVDSTTVDPAQRSATITKRVMVGSADGKSRKMSCMPLKKLPGWLMTIDPGRIQDEEVRARVIQYQDECDDVLWQYWNDGMAVNPRMAYSVNPDDVLTAEQAESLRLILKQAVDRAPKHRQAALMIKGWSKLKAHFKVGYRQIPQSEYTEAVSLLSRHISAEWELVEEQPVAPRKSSNLDWLDPTIMERARSKVDNYVGTLLEMVAGAGLSPPKFDSSDDDELTMCVLADMLRNKPVMISFDHQMRANLSISKRSHMTLNTDSEEQMRHVIRVMDDKAVPVIASAAFQRMERLYAKRS